MVLNAPTSISIIYDEVIPQCLITRLDKENQRDNSKHSICHTISDEEIFFLRANVKNVNIFHG